MWTLFFDQWGNPSQGNQWRQVQSQPRKLPRTTDGTTHLVFLQSARWFLGWQLNNWLVSLCWILFRCLLFSRWRPIMQPPQKAAHFAICEPPPSAPTLRLARQTKPVPPHLKRASEDEGRNGVFYAFSLQGLRWMFNSSRSLLFVFWSCQLAVGEFLRPGSFCCLLSAQASFKVNYVPAQPLERSVFTYGRSKKDEENSSQSVDSQQRRANHQKLAFCQATNLQKYRSQHVYK